MSVFFLFVASSNTFPSRKLSKFALDAFDSSDSSQRKVLAKICLRHYAKWRRREHQSGSNFPPASRVEHWAALGREDTVADGKGRQTSHSLTSLAADNTALFGRACFILYVRFRCVASSATGRTLCCLSSDWHIGVIDHGRARKCLFAP